MDSGEGLKNCHSVGRILREALEGFCSLLGGLVKAAQDYSRVYILLQQLTHSFFVLVAFFPRLGACQRHLYFEAGISLRSPYEILDVGGVYSPSQNSYHILRQVLLFVFGQAVGINLIDETCAACQVYTWL
ncbi:hypothetical protein ES703_57644 [subsurface metagenome]